jgi:hypothetical protein
MVDDTPDLLRDGLPGTTIFAPGPAIVVAPLTAAIFADADETTAGLLATAAVGTFAGGALDLGGFRTELPAVLSRRRAAPEDSSWGSRPHSPRPSVAHKKKEPTMSVFRDQPMWVARRAPVLLILAYSTGAAALAGEGAGHVQQDVTILHFVRWIGPLFLANAAACAATTSV